LPSIALVSVVVVVALAVAAALAIVVAAWVVTAGVTIAQEKLLLLPNSASY
jgi:hypothetical protein